MEEVGIDVVQNWNAADMLICEIWEMPVSLGNFQVSLLNFERILEQL